MAPIIYIPNWLTEIANVDDLWNTLPWEKREDTPRHECWMNDYDLPYTYGSGNGVRTYDAKPWHLKVNLIRNVVEQESRTEFNCCFINGYENEKQALGWHADDSPEISNDHPIAIVSFGAEREIYFREKDAKGTGESVTLGNRSLLFMKAGMQLTHKHKIPKGNKPSGKRISLTYRFLLRKV